MEENKTNDQAVEEKFLVKLAELLEIAKKKKNVIEDTEIINHFSSCKEIDLNTDRMVAIFEYLEEHNVDVLTITEEDDEPDDIILDNDDVDVDVDVEHIDLSIPDGVSIEDPVRMYLKEDW